MVSVGGAGSQDSRLLSLALGEPGTERKDWDFVSCLAAGLLSGLGQDKQLLFLAASIRAVPHPRMEGCGGILSTSLSLLGTGKRSGNSAH